VFSGGRFTGGGFRSGLNYPKVGLARITLLILPGKRPWLNFSSRFKTRKKKACDQARPVWRQRTRLETAIVAGRPLDNRPSTQWGRCYSAHAGNDCWLRRRIDDLEVHNGRCIGPHYRLCNSGSALDQICGERRSAGAADRQTHLLKHRDTIVELASALFAKHFALAKVDLHILGRRPKQPPVGLVSRPSRSYRANQWRKLQIAGPCRCFDRL
jgi:hypothetical protein